MSTINNVNVAGQVSDAIHAQAAQVKPVAVAMAQADKTFDAVMPNTASAVAKILGTSPTYVLWNQVSYDFKSSYMAARGCVAGQAENRWAEVTKYMEKNFSLTKPAAPTVAADKKAKERAAKEKAIKSAKAKFVKPADAFKAAEELMQAGKVNEAKIVQEAAVSLSKDVTDNAKKQAGESIKKAKDAVKAALLKCEDLATLQAALDLLKFGKEVKEAKPAKKAVAEKV